MFFNSHLAGKLEPLFEIFYFSKYNVVLLLKKFFIVLMFWNSTEDFLASWRRPSERAWFWIQPVLILQGVSLNMEIDIVQLPPTKLA